MRQLRQKIKRINLTNVNRINNYIIPNSDNKIKNKTKRERQKVKRPKEKEGRTPNELT